MMSMFRKIYTAFLALLLLLLFPSIVSADNNVIVSTDSSFSSETRTVSPGQMMYVRVSANNNGGTKAILTLKTNTSAPITSYTLPRISEKVFSVSFPAPAQQGTYLLDAEVVENGSSSKSVYSFSVGQGSSSVTTVVKSETSGSSSINSSTSVSSQGTTVVTGNDDVSVVTVPPSQVTTPPSTNVSAESSVTTDTSSTSSVTNSSPSSDQQPSVFARVVSACIYVAGEFIKSLF